MDLPAASVTIAFWPASKLSSVPSPLVSIWKPVTASLSFSGSVSFVQHIAAGRCVLNDDLDVVDGIRPVVHRGDRSA